MPTRPSRVAICVLLLPAVLMAQASQPRPTFRSGIQTIEVDVLVKDQKGNFVRGLTKDDFILVEDGNAQPITNFSVVDLPLEPPASRAAAAKEVETDITTNVGEGRMYMMLINPPPPGGDALRQRLIARRFVEEAVGPNDQMAVIHVLGKASAAQGFTRSRSLILSAIDRLEFDDSIAPVSPRRISFELLEQVCERLGLVTGRRKVVLWVDPPSMFIPGSNEIGDYFAQRYALRAATRNNVAVYPISTLGLTTVLGNLEYKAGLQVLSDETGGETIVESNNFTPLFQGFVRDNSTYYLLAYEPTVEHRDGKFHKLTVRVKNRSRLTVRARSGYYAPEPDTKARPRLAVVEGLSVETADAVRMPSSVGELGIDLFAAPFKGDGLTASVLLGAQLRGTDLVLGGGERIEIAYQATTTEGAITPGAFKVLTLDFKPESRPEIVRTGLRVIDRIELPKGRHQVRFAVHQPNGKTGSVVADVEIPDYRAPLLLSGVVIGSQQASAHRTLMSDATLKSILSLEPTALRRFSRRDVITAFAEVYTDPRRPEPARVAARVTPAKGGRAHSPEISMVPGAPDRAGYTMRLRLGDLSPGDYVLTVEATTPRTTAMRQVPFAVVAD